MDLKELRQLTEPELAEKGQQLTQELFNLRFQLGTGRLENPMQVRKTKRSIRSEERRVGKECVP